MSTLESQTYELSLPSAELVLDMTAELSDPSSTWHQQFYDHELGVAPTPVWQMPEKANGHALFIKDETVHAVAVEGVKQEIGTFKRRGAWAAALACGQEADVLTAASAGNHAQGVAAAAALLGKRCEVYCRKNVSSVKRARNKALGADVLDEYDRLEDAMLDAELRRGLGEDGLLRVNIRPFDQAEVIAGQATMVVEWLESMEALQAEGSLDLLHDSMTVVVPVGGGGLIAGWGVGLELARRQGRIGNNVRLVGAQMHGCDAMNRALGLGDSYDGTVVLRQDELNEACDGTAVVRPGSLTIDIVRRYVDEIMVLSPAELGVGMSELTQILAKDIEPAGALAYTAAQKLMAMSPAAATERSSVTCVATGANVSEETKRYFEDRVKIAAAQERFRAQSARALQDNQAYRQLIKSAVNFDRPASTTAVSSSPTWQYRAKPHKERAEYLASR